MLRLPNWLGDVVMARPAVAAIRQAYPQATLVAQARGAFVPLARALPGIETALPAGRDRSLGDLRESVRRLRDHAFDMAVVFPRSFRAAVAPWRAKIPLRVGLAGRGKGRLLTHGIEGWRPLRSQHRSAFYGALAHPFGQPLPEGLPSLRVSDDDREAAHRLLLSLGRQTGRPLIALEPGASYGPAKCWPAGHFAELAKRLLRDERFDVITVGVPASEAVEAQIARVAGPRLLRAVGRTPDLGTLMGILAATDLLVTNDTGPMHLAAALGTSTFAIFGATDPVVSSPLGPGPRTLLYDPEPCSPCFLRACPIAGHPCLTKVSVDRVHAHVIALTSDAPQPAPSSAAQ